MRSTERSAIAGMDERFATLIVVALAIAASITSLFNGFALDDVPIIARNDAVHSLSNLGALFSRTYWPPDYGQSLYRPLTSVAFTLQWVLGDGSPLPFHALSILLYAAVSVALYRLAIRFMSPPAALAGASIFAVHPLHVEAVANVVGQAELWTALLVVVALIVYIDAREGEGVGARATAVIAALYGAALMFKENAIVLPGMILAAELTLPSRASLLRRIQRALPTLAASTVVAVVFLFVRTSVIGKFTGGSTATVFVGQDYSARFFTMLNVIPEWLRLFVWPARLSADYSPPRVTTATSFDAAMIPALLVLVAVVMIAVRARRGHPGLTLALSIAGIALLIPSNLIIVTGVALAERVLFLPTAGLALAAGYGFAQLAMSRPGRSRRLALAFASAILVAGVGRSATRGLAWRDNETLFRQTVRDVPTSYRAHLMLGELLTDKGETAEGLTELAKAVSLSRPQDYFVRWFAADRFHAAGQLEIAIGYYKEALALKPSDPRVRYGAAMALASSGRGGDARSIAAEGVERHPSDERFARIVHAMDSIRAAAPGA